jgi:hypothetical protein
MPPDDLARPAQVVDLVAGLQPRAFEHHVNRLA